MKILTTTTLSLGAGLLLLSLSAYAHLPICDCQVEGSKVVCEGGYSDGSAAFDTPIQVIDYDEKVLVSGKLDAQSRFVFDLPEGDFYIFVDGGVGHTVEVDRADIKGIDA